MIVVFLLMLAAVAWVVYRWCYKATESKLASSGAAIAGVGAFIMVLNAGLHAALHN